MSEGLQQDRGVAASPPGETKPLSCSFCEKNQHQVQRLVAAFPDVAICNECVALCAMICVAEAEEGKLGALYLSRRQPVNSTELIKAIVRQLREEDAASAIEARQGGNGEAGAVEDESAARNAGDAQ